MNNVQKQQNNKIRLKINLDDELEQEFDLINKEYKKMQSAYRPNIDAFMSEDKNFTKRVIRFIVNVIDYIIKNYDKIKIKDYQDFLGYYDMYFYYGPNGDDMNYFDSDSNRLNGEYLKEFCWGLRNDDVKMTKKKLNEIKSKYNQILSNP